ncbi:cytidylyltransferase domain-containing protein [Acetobacterium carbinolicum]|uniref:cytidylyltransferase domain-containing protein n=1 Tax=Acetobacterium carbinolicum TaxID=52690 RepID=UPI0039C90F4E
MKVICIVQARVGSSRLPGKVLKVICGKTVLQHVAERLRRVKNIDELIIATTELDADDQIIDECLKLNIKYFRGSEKNVLSRYYLAAKENQADIVVRVTSDCPLIDPKTVEKIIDCYLTNHNIYDYVSNTIDRTFPRGLDAEVFSFASLQRSFISASKEYEREHVTPYIYQHLDEFKIFQYKNKIDYSDFRWTLDTEEDFQVIRIIYEALYEKKQEFDFADILDFVQKNEYINAINKDIRQKKLGE